MMKRSLLFLVLVLPGTGPALAQDSLPRWRLGDPRLTISGEAFELHRVSDAAFLSGGRIVVADAGNARLLLFSSDGRLVRSMGRKGAGPGDIQLLWSMAVFQDTILTYDPGLSRVSVWTAEDGFIRSHSLVDRTHLQELQAFVSPTRFLVTRRTRTVPHQAGLLTDIREVLLVDAVQERTQSIGQRPWQHQFMYHHENGSTGYRTPFLGSAHIAAVGTRALTVPLGAAEVEIGPVDGAAVHHLPLPVPRRAFDRTLIESYRDSLIASTRRSTIPMPGAVERIGDVFGPSFPLPENRPVIERAQTVGDEVWLRRFPERGERTPWYVVDLELGRLVAAVDVPIGWRVLGGTGGRVLVLQRDPDGVESVVVYDVERSAR
jgi:hypothetical protein